MSNNTSARKESTSDSLSEHSAHPDSRSDLDADSKNTPAKEELKIYKTISRVHRACNACRKQKARCDGPENPPCRRCRQVGIECIFEKPPKDPSSSTTNTADTGASSDRIRLLEAQMSGMQSMISELVASIKANTNAIAAPPQPPPPPQPQQQPPQHSPHASSVSAASPLSSRASRSDRYTRPRHHNVPLQQQPYAQPPHHRNSHPAGSPATEFHQHYTPDTMTTDQLQRPPYPPSSGSLTSTSSHAGTVPIHAAPGYPLQQPPNFQTAYGHPPSKNDDHLLQHHSDLDAFQRRSRSRPGHDTDIRDQPSNPWQHPHLAASAPVSALSHGVRSDVASSSPSDPSAAAAATSSGWTPTPAMPAYQRSHSSRRRWTSSDRAGSHSLSNDQNLTPSDGPGAADDGDHRETDISNDQLSAPIEALRGLADAAAAAAAEESEGHTSNDSSDEKNHGTDDNPSRSGRGAGDADAASVLQQGDEPTERNAARHEDKSGEGGGQSPRKKRRRDTNGASPNAAGGANAASDTQAGVGGTGTTPKASGSMGVGAAAPSPSNAAGGAGRSGKMEAPGLVTSAPGDLVTLGLVTESDAMRLFETFQKGVPKFISIFHLEDEPMTTAEAYHHVRTTSYFLFNVMLAIGAKVECGGKSPSRLYQTCMAQAKRNAKDTMFSPVAGKSAVQAMVLLAAYSENGWLPLGLSIRMAQELGLDRSFQKLMSALPASGYIKHPQPPPPPKHLTFYHNSPQSSHYTGSPTDVNSVGGELMDGKTGANVAGANAVAAVAAANGNADAAAKRELDELKDLARGARLWFFLFLFDHQASYGAGRPAMLSKHYVRNCRAFLSLDYPLTVKTDARFISTLELLIIRETHYDAMAPYDQPVDARMLSKMRKVTEELNEWHQYWSTDFESRGYAHDSFFQQSLILQCASAELYLSCTALRGIRNANDADQMGPEQKELIIQATRAADTCLSISVNAKEYREMLGWAPHYTHVTAAFACVFLIKIARLFPRQVDTYGIFSNAERLASRLAEVPASKYARVIRILLAQAWKKIADLSPAIGLYAALGAEATRPGAITPAEIKTGGPSDSGISLLYKLLQEYQNGQLEGDEDAGRGEGGAQSVHADGAGAGGEGASGARTPGFGDLANSSKWLMTGISSPSVGGAALGAAGSGAMSPNKAATAGLFSHRDSISGFDQHVGGSTGNAGNDGLAWSSLIGAGTPSASHGGGAFISDGSLINATTHQPIQLPLWMQESTGGAGDLGAFDTPAGGAPEASEVKPAAAARSWGHQDHYQSPVPHASQYTSPVYQTPQTALHPNARQDAQPMGMQAHHPRPHMVPASPAPQLQQGLQPFNSTNFDTVLSDLGLPLDGLDGLFGDLPINAPTAQSNYSV
ncbi:hypothetical protein PaG_04121 [Moesziomyces aphidis]|uniref:Zn(2)-C6 fungal-type domain-containing protein n=1 Tax=Moesziomyces aphidis TaxID=84754 RepID=W3VJA5_MOEAP|nr:hypothetical protein PaG_04121 [Moesziomyces aphidis]